jgi:hypothetical protein
VPAPLQLEHYRDANPPSLFPGRRGRVPCRTMQMAHVWPCQCHRRQWPRNICETYLGSGMGRHCQSAHVCEDTDRSQCCPGALQTMNGCDSHWQRATKAMARRTLKAAPRRILINVRRSTSGAGSPVCRMQAMANARSVSRADFLGGIVCAICAGAGFPPHTDRKVVLRRIRAVCLRCISHRLLLVRLAERPVPGVPDEDYSHRCTRPDVQD